MSRSKKRNHSDRKSAFDFLHEWQLDRLEQDRELPLPAYGPTEVTLLTYHFRPKEQADARFPFVECAIRESWRRCGFLRTVIVTNEETPLMRAFADQFNGRVEIQVEETLIPGRPETMSADCNGRLYERFLTPYVLIIQEDAFPLRPGIGTFLDGYDFFGAPRKITNWWSFLSALLFNSRMMNGNFSLRSRRMCQMVAAEWRLRYADAPFERAFINDLFYTHTLPRKSFSFRRDIKFPQAEQAAQFAFDTAISRRSEIPPFGFHGAQSFRILKNSGKYDI